MEFIKNAKYCVAVVERPSLSRIHYVFFPEEPTDDDIGALYDELDGMEEFTSMLKEGTTYFLTVLDSEEMEETRTMFMECEYDRDD